MLVMMMLAVLAIAPTISKAEETGMIEIGGFEIPARIGDFVAGRSIDNETGNPRLGYTIPYSHPRHYKATVFIYDFGIEAIPDGALSEINKAHFQQIVGATMRAGATNEIQLVETYGAGTPQTGVQFLCAELKFGDAGQEMGTYVYLTGFRNAFIKVRITTGRYDRSDPTSRDFVDALAKVLGL